MLKFVFFNVSNESEYSDSELFCPGELSFAELLQSPTYSETQKIRQDSSQMQKFTSLPEKNQRKARKQLIRINGIKGESF